MTNNVLNLVVAATALWLIGVNIAVIYRFWPEPWLIAKLVAVSALLFYIVLSVTYGNPDEWRVWIGFFAICLDVGSILGIWHSLHKARSGNGTLVAYKRR